MTDSRKLSEVDGTLTYAQRSRQKPARNTPDRAHDAADRREPGRLLALEGRDGRQNARLRRDQHQRATDESSPRLLRAARRADPRGTGHRPSVPEHAVCAPGPLGAGHEQGEHGTRSGSIGRHGEGETDALPAGAPLRRQAHRPGGAVLSSLQERLLEPLVCAQAAREAAGVLEPRPARELRLGRVHERRDLLERLERHAAANAALAAMFRHTYMTVAR